MCFTTQTSANEIASQSITRMNDLQVLVPLMLAVFFAKLVGDAIGLSVYDTHIKIKGAPVLVRFPIDRSLITNSSEQAQSCADTSQQLHTVHSGSESAEFDVQLQTGHAHRRTNRWQACG